MHNFQKGHRYTKNLPQLFFFSNLFIDYKLRLFRVFLFVSIVQGKGLKIVTNPRFFFLLIRENNYEAAKTYIYEFEVAITSRLWIIIGSLRKKT